MAMRKENEELALEEEQIAQLKLDERGKVLMAPTVAKDENESPAPKPTVEAPKSVKIVALDRSKPAAPAAPLQKPAKPEETAASEVVPTPVPAPTPESEKPAQVTLACYRIGPFEDQNSMANVRRALNRNSMRYSVDKRGAEKQIKAVRIYLGNFSSTDAMQAETTRLKQMEIDHYVVKLSDRSVIQLGYFSEPARATAYQKTLKSRGVNASAEMIYREAKTDSWFDVKQASDEFIKALDLPTGVTAKQQA
jgi:cell division septation protein DedD